MTYREHTTELTKAELLEKFSAVSRRFLSMAEVLHDAIGPWLRGGRAKDIIEASEDDSGAITEICETLFKNMAVAQMLLGIQTPSLREYRSECWEEKESREAPNQSQDDPTALRLLSFVWEIAREATDHAIALRKDPSRWLQRHEAEIGTKVLGFELRSLDYTRWQILKEFAKLVSLFDDHDDPDSDTPCEAWQKDRVVLDNDSLGEQ